MGFRRFLLSYFNPTVVWEEDLVHSLTFDLGENRLCGIAIGDAVEELSFLGPAKVSANKLFHLFGMKHYTGEFAWLQKGFDVGVENGCLEGMAFYFGHAAEAKYGEFIGCFLYRGRKLRLSKELNESDILSLFGQPSWRDQDEDEIILFYEFPNYEWQLELDLEGFLKCLVVCAPILADAKQRASYADTKPWPPNYS